MCSVRSMLERTENRQIPFTLRDRMTREQLKKWFDKLPKHHFAEDRMRIVTWEDIKNLVRRIDENHIQKSEEKIK